MIVRQAGDVLHLITQPAHAALSRRVMERWQPLHDADRRGSILLAIEEHDNGWREVDEDPTVDPATGAVYDFINAPAPLRQSVWPRGIHRLASDPWAAALVAQHALTVYSRYRDDAEWQHFFQQITATRDRLVGLTRSGQEQLERDYRFVRIGDLISLVFCNDWHEPQHFDEATVRGQQGAVFVTPDAFGGRELPITVVAREIPNRAYESDDDLHQTLRRAPAITLHGIVRGS